MSDYGTRAQPAPTGDGREVWPLVWESAKRLLAFRRVVYHSPKDEAVGLALLEDMRARDAMGRERYGTPLRVDNGRDALVDWYHEVLDSCAYSAQVLERNPEDRDVLAWHRDAVYMALKLRTRLYGRDGR